jgi:hypothetical protein
MTVNDVITVGQIAVPAGCSFAHEDDQPVVTVTILRTAVEEETAAEGEDGEAAAESDGEASDDSSGEASGDDAE